MSNWLDGWTFKDVFGPSIVFALILGLIGLYYARKGSARRDPVTELSFGVIGQTLVAGASETISDRMKLSFDGCEVAQLSKAFVAAMNTGDLPIKAADFEGDLLVQPSGITRLFSASLSHCFPGSLAPSIKQRGNEVVVAPLLLNPGDYLVIELTAENFERIGSTLKARVSGVSIFPVLRVGTHPGYDIGSKLYWGGVSLVFLLLGIFGLRSHLYFSGGFVFILSLGAAIGCFQTLQENRAARRRRYMGKTTEGIASIAGIKSK